MIRKRNLKSRKTTTTKRKKTKSCCCCCCSCSAGASSAAAPEAKRGFRTPAAWLVGAVAIFGCAYLFYSLPSTTQIYFLIAHGVGMIIYTAYGVRRSIAGRSAVLNASVASTGNDPPAVTLYFGPTDGGTNPAAWASSFPLDSLSSSPSRSVSPLAPLTTYFCRAAATNRWARGVVGRVRSWWLGARSTRRPWSSTAISSHQRPAIARS